MITQAAFEDEVSRICGSSAMSGVTRVCMIAAVVPAKASVAITAPRRAVGGRAGAPMGLLDVEVVKDPRTGLREGTT